MDRSIIIGIILLVCLSKATSQDNFEGIDINVLPDGVPEPLPDGIPEPLPDGIPDPLPDSLPTPVEEEDIQVSPTTPFGCNDVSFPPSIGYSTSCTLTNGAASTTCCKKESGHITYICCPVAPGESCPSPFKFPPCS